MPLDFTAIDFETANSAAASPCAVGLVRVRDGVIVETHSTLIRPPYPNQDFSLGNIQIHGIRPSDVETAPDAAEGIAQILEFVAGDALIAHYAKFDMAVLRETARLIQYPLPPLAFGCSLNIAKGTYQLESYGLKSVAYAIGHEEFQHHDALADADASARIVIHAAKRHGLDDLTALLHQVGKPLQPLIPMVRANAGAPRGVSSASAPETNNDLDGGWARPMS